MASVSPPPPAFSEIPIIHKTYKFYLLFYSCAINFPKKDRHTLAKKCEQLVLEILELLFEANAARSFERIAFLKKSDLKLKILKTMVRFSFDVRAIDQKKYLFLEKSLQEIGKMLGGWIKSINEKPRAMAG